MSLRARFQLDWPGFSLDVDLDLPDHGVTALFGPSGCGKTTLLRCIAGLERTPGGNLRLGDAIWQDGTSFLPTHQRPIGYVFQEASLFPHLSVQGNLEYGLKRAVTHAHKADSQERLKQDKQHEHLNKLTELLGITHLLDRQPERLSGGERQRVAMARALAISPRILLMDEPLAALDLARKQEVLPYLERLHAELQIPVLYVSHSAEEVARLADHIVVMQAGRVMASGPLSETLARIDLPIQLGDDAGVVLDAIVSKRDSQWHLAYVVFDTENDLGVWVRDSGHAVGQHVRIRILARDISLTLDHQTGTSILNILPASVLELAEDGHPAQTLVRLNTGNAPLIARLTHRSAHDLGLCPGKKVFAQIKAVALIG